MNNIDGDREAYDDHLNRERQLYGERWAEFIDVAKREQGWSRELDGHWHIIQVVAAMLLAGDTVDHDTVEQLVEAHWTALTA